MPDKNNNHRDSLAAGNAAGLQKLEIQGFSEETQRWAWDNFKYQAMNLSKKNHFRPEDWTAMEALALEEILSDDSISWDPTDRLTLEQCLSGVIHQKLGHAAAQIADERAVWFQSRVSLDAKRETDGGDGASLVDIVTDTATLGVNQRLFGKPRAIAIRNLIKRLRDTKQYAKLEAFKAQLCGEKVKAEEACEASDDEKLEEFGDRRIIGHATAVAEVGYYQRDDSEEMPENPAPLHARSAGFGNPVAAIERMERRIDIKNVLRRLDPIDRRWCRRVMQKDDPVDAYKELGMGKNYFYKKFLPKLRQLLKEYAPDFIPRLLKSPHRQ